MKYKILGLVLGLALVAAACNKSQPSTTPTPTPTPTPAPTSTVPQTVEIAMTSTGFSPSSITIKKGDTVKFINQDTKNRWPASAPHPTHTDYPEFDPKKGVAAGESWSFTFDQLGTWKFHDHVVAGQYGSVKVE